MASKVKLIPGKDAKFDAMFKNVCQVTQVKTSGTPPDWPHIPAAPITALNGGYADWFTFYAPTLKDHTRAQTAAKNTARRRDQPILEDFIQTWFRRFPDIVTEADLISMGIPPIDRNRSHIGKPKTHPIFHITVLGPGLLAISFYDEATPESSARPYGMNGAVISFVVSHDGRVITKFSELIHTVLATHTPFRLHFDEEDRGKMVYIAMQWQNESGDRGDPTEIQCAIVP